MKLFQSLVPFDGLAHHDVIVQSLFSRTANKSTCLWKRHRHNITVMVFYDKYIFIEQLPVSLFFKDRNNVSAIYPYIGTQTYLLFLMTLHYWQLIGLSLLWYLHYQQWWWLHAMTSLYHIEHRAREAGKQKWWHGRGGDPGKKIHWAW